MCIALGNSKALPYRCVQSLLILKWRTLVPVFFRICMYHTPWLYVRMKAGEKCIQIYPQNIYITSHLYIGHTISVINNAM